MQGDDEAEELKARLAKLTSALQVKREAAEKSDARQGDVNTSAKGLGQAMSLGFRVLSEFVAAILVSALIGWRADIWLDTSPFLLILFLGLGVAAGFWNIYRLAVPPPGRRGL